MTTKTKSSRRAGFLALCGGQAVLAGLTAAVLFVLGKPSWIPSAAAGFLAAWAAAVLNYGMLVWALNRSNDVYFSVFMAGSFVRFLGFAMAAFLVLRFTDLSLVGFSSALAVSFILLSFVEAHFIQKEAKRSP